MALTYPFLSLRSCVVNVSGMSLRIGVRVWHGTHVAILHFAGQVQSEVNRDETLVTLTLKCR